MFHLAGKNICHLLQASMMINLDVKIDIIIYSSNAVFKLVSLRLYELLETFSFHIYLRLNFFLD